MLAGSVARACNSILGPWVQDPRWMQTLLKTKKAKQKKPSGKTYYSCALMALWGFNYRLTDEAVLELFLKIKKLDPFVGLPSATLLPMAAH